MFGAEGRNTKHHFHRETTICHTHDEHFAECCVLVCTMFQLKRKYSEWLEISTALSDLLFVFSGMSLSPTNNTLLAKVWLVENYKRKFHCIAPWGGCSRNSSLNLLFQEAGSAPLLFLQSINSINWPGVPGGWLLGSGEGRDRTPGVTLRKVA